MPLNGTELIEKHWLQELISSPDLLDQSSLTLDEALDRLNRLIYKEIHDEEDEPGRN
jgi:hypothetical protein